MAWDSARMNAVLVHITRCGAMISHPHGDSDAAFAGNGRRGQPGSGVVFDACGSLQRRVDATPVAADGHRNVYCCNQLRGSQGRLPLHASTMETRPH